MPTAGSKSGGVSARMWSTKGVLESSRAGDRSSPPLPRDATRRHAPWVARRHCDRVFRRACHSRSLRRIPKAKTSPALPFQCPLRPRAPHTRALPPPPPSSPASVTPCWHGSPPSWRRTPRCPGPSNPLDPSDPSDSKEGSNPDPLPHGAALCWNAPRPSWRRSGAASPVGRRRGGSTRRTSCWSRRWSTIRRRWWWRYVSF